MGGGSRQPERPSPPPEVQAHYSRLICIGSGPYFFSSSAVGSRSGRTTRKPTKVASVWYHLLCGIWGSWIFQSGFEANREALRHSSAGAVQLPPRVTRGYNDSGSRIGFLVSLPANLA